CYRSAPRLPAKSSSPTPGGRNRPRPRHEKSRCWSHLCVRPVQCLFPTLRIDTMLRELSVQNLAIIEDVRVDLQPGFCAWTGETGAGKSLLLGALGLLLGERGSADLIRSGADELRVTGRFDVRHPDTRQQVEQILDAKLNNGEVLL